jgi:DNA-binding response OmpR family regulator
MKKNILIVSDKIEIYQPIWLNAAAVGFEPRLVDSYQEASRILPQTSLDVLILDSKISSTSATSILEGLRSSVHTRHMPVIVVASNDYENEHLPMFDAGADDVIRVPLPVRELFARVNAVTRPRSVKASPPHVSLGAITIDPEFRRIFIRDHGKNIDVTMPPKAFEVFRVLSMRPGELLTRAEILSSVWGATTSITIRSVDVQITFLRGALRRIGAGLHIEAVPQKGYRLCLADDAPCVVTTADG